LVLLVIAEASFTSSFSSSELDSWSCDAGVSPS
jgi:hypothetical protein